MPETPSRGPRAAGLLSRRELLRAGAAAGVYGLGISVLPSLARAQAATPFTLGVASGDPGSSRVTLWTRLAPDPLNGGGMPPVHKRVAWEVATDPTMQNVIRSGSVVARPEGGHSVHARAAGLPEDAWLWYRFEVDGVTSPIGRTRTFPRRSAHPARMRFALVSCQNYEAGFYSAYHNLAQEDLDFVVHVGDYIYEGGASATGVRMHDGPEILTLKQYRNRYALYKLDPELQAAHAAFPFISTWDDHEVDNNHTGLFDSSGNPLGARRDVAYQAYSEHMPLPRQARLRRPGRPMRLYRSFDFGRLGQIVAADTRQFRDPGACTPVVASFADRCPAAFAPDLQFLGSRQERFVSGRLRRSRATWNLLAQSVMVMQWRIGNLVNFDAWDGYPGARGRLLDWLAADRPANPVVLTGDVHSSWAANLHQDFDDLASPIVGTEFVCPGISSAPAPIPQPQATNPHVQYFQTGVNGYVRFDVTPSALRADFRFVDSVLDPTAGASTAASFEVEAGTPAVTTL